jgi:hypothetical protein
VLADGDAASAVTAAALARAGELHRAALSRVAALV